MPILNRAALLRSCLKKDWPGNPKMLGEESKEAFGLPTLNSRRIPVGEKNEGDDSDAPYVLRPESFTHSPRLSDFVH